MAQTNNDHERGGPGKRCRAFGDERPDDSPVLGARRGMNPDSRGGSIAS